MKRYTFILLISFLQLTVSAQKLLVPDNYIGVKGGGGAAVFNMDINTDYPFYFLESINGGIVFKTYETRTTALQLELAYTEKGGVNFYDKSLFGSDTLGMPVAEYFKLKTRGYEFVALTHLSFGTGVSKLIVNFGPYAYYINDSKISSPPGQTLIHKIYPERKLDLGLKVGIGYGLNFKKTIMEVELRYGHGLINVYNFQKINNALINQNQVLMLNLLLCRKLKNK